MFSLRFGNDDASHPGSKHLRTGRTINYLHRASVPVPVVLVDRPYHCQSILNATAAGLRQTSRRNQPIYRGTMGQHDSIVSRRLCINWAVHPTPSLLGTFSLLQHLYHRSENAFSIPASRLFTTAWRRWMSVVTIVCGARTLNGNGPCVYQGFR